MVKKGNLPILDKTDITRTKDCKLQKKKKKMENNKNKRKYYG